MRYLPTIRRSWGLLLLLLATTALPAQNEQVNALLERIGAKLQLTDEQRPAVAAILTDFVERARAQPPAGPEAKRAAKRAVRRKILQLLTPEQQAALRSQRQGRANATPGTEAPPPPSATEVVTETASDPPPPLPEGPAAAHLIAPAGDSTATSVLPTTVRRKQNWLDVLLDDVLLPLLERRRN